MVVLASLAPAKFPVPPGKLAWLTAPEPVPAAVNVSPFAATIVKVNVLVEQSELVHAPSVGKVPRPRCVLLDVPSRVKVAGVPGDSRVPRQMPCMAGRFLWPWQAQLAH